MDEVLIQYLQQASTLRVYRAATNVDLAQYQEPFPGQRIVSISEAAYNDRKRPTPTLVVPTDPETPIKGNNSDPATGSTAANGTSNQNHTLPKTGEKNEFIHLLGSWFSIVSLAGIYSYNRNRLRNQKSLKWFSQKSS